MKKRHYIVIFIIVFLLSALLEMKYLGGIPERVLRVNWTDETGTVYRDLAYGELKKNTYDLYIPHETDKAQNQRLILFIHGGSFNSGSKEDGATWCEYYASKGFIAASVNYTLQDHDTYAPLSLMNDQIEAAVSAIKNEIVAQGYNANEMAVCGVSAGGTLAMNFASTGQSDIPVKFVFQL
ncbi:MAG: alpha/beta hydrolase, partial [Bacillota bacterium]|nr:alpha/beta hydrolase [Bacillota bacterium]